MPAPVRPADPESIRAAAELIRTGRLVAFPTETVYGLGGNAFDTNAVARIFAVKGRPATNPLIVHVTGVEAVSTVAAEWPAAAERLAASFWPGPLTLVLPKHPDLSPLVTAGGNTVAVRCPAHPVAAALLREAGIPIAAPSANRSGELSPTTAEHVRKGLADHVDLILDGGPCPGGIESTVVDLASPAIRLLRPGLISPAAIERVIGPFAIIPTEAAAGSPLPSPGMLSRHYAPRTALELAETTEEFEFLVNLYERAGLRVARWEPVGEPESVAARLYADLHSLDDSRYDRIIARLPPDTDAWRAVRDRLIRAAAE